MSEQKTKMRFDDGELIAIKNVFADNEELAKVVRRVFLQSEMSVEDYTIITKTFKTDELKALITKFFKPEIIGDEHFHQIVDLWLTIDTKEKPPEQVIPTIKARGILIKYITQQIERLFNLTSTETISLKELINFEGKDDYDMFINLLARNTIVQHVEQMLSQIVLLAGQKSETVEQTKARLQKNSTK